MKRAGPGRLADGCSPSGYYARTWHSVAWMTRVAQGGAMPCSVHALQHYRRCHPWPDNKSDVPLSGHHVGRLRPRLDCCTRRNAQSAAIHMRTSAGQLCANARYITCRTSLGERFVRGLSLLSVQLAKRYRRSRATPGEVPGMCDVPAVSRDERESHR